MSIIEKDSLPFSVDAQLLKELGERLVGRPYIALAELIKNSYDADANEVIVTLDKTEDMIIVNDDGHGMTFEEFRDFWMRIGSTHKRDMRVSKYLGRRMTGSKGVGRLAVQFLAESLEVVTCSRETPNQQLKANVDWSKAVEADDLTSATVEYEIETGGEYNEGTILYLRELKTKWSEKDIEGLAREVWWLQPPFRKEKHVTGPKNRFFINFISHKNLIEAFEEQMNSILNIWHARIVGEAHNGNAQVSIEWAGEKTKNRKYKRENCKLENVEFEVRVYHLWERQPRGIKVNEAREYMNKFGGVNIYDGGFRLPFYGDPKNDWLGIELDHSHRRTTSKFLPASIQEGIGRRLQFLPTNSRLFGVVRIDTSKEDNLEILVTRDRLKETRAYEDLQWIVRYAIDLYALWEKKRSLREMESLKETTQERVRSVEEVLNDYKDDIGPDKFPLLKSEVVAAIERTRTEAEFIAEQVGLVGALATAGITSLAYAHDTKTVFKKIKNVMKKMQELENAIRHKPLKSRINEIRNELTKWIQQIEKMNLLFRQLRNPENVKERKRFVAKKVINEVKRQMSPLLKGVPIKISRVDKELLLPKAAYAEWSSIFQNVFLNAYNAMLVAKHQIIDISSRVQGFRRDIIVQDTGLGVDLENSDELFDPFIRGTNLPDDLKELGYGGSGLGLSIVRMIAANIGCRVGFIEPEPRFRTAFSLSWRETK